MTAKQRKIELSYFESYLPAIITAFIIVPLGVYVQARLKNLATKEDFDDAIAQLQRSTNAVESIKIQLNEKYWVKQQIWDTKRIAYEELTASLYLSNKYLESLIDYFDNYIDCFVNIGCSSVAPYESPAEEEYQRSYQDYIENEQKAFRQSYESEDSHNERNKLFTMARDSIINLDNLFSIKSIYLHVDLKYIEREVEKIKNAMLSK
ncbi:MAG TPA: hypothetical protein VGE32_01100, partial [Cellvibrio sp.]